jgi:hypothetical protein
MPSATSFRRTDASSPEEWVGSFDALPSHVVDAVANVLATAGLGELYGREPEPLVGPADVARAARGARPPRAR